MKVFIFFLIIAFCSFQQKAIASELTTEVFSAKNSSKESIHHPKKMMYLSKKTNIKEVTPININHSTQEAPKIHTLGILKTLINGPNPVLIPIICIILFGVLIVAVVAKAWELSKASFESSKHIPLQSWRGF